MVGYRIKKAIIYIALSLLAVTCIIPFLLMMVNSTRSGREIMTFFTLIPSTHLKENWDAVWGFFNLFQGMWNSLKIAVPSTILSAYFSALTAFALAVYKFKGKNIVFYTLVIFMMIPGQLSLIGFYNLVSSLKLMNSYVPLIIPAIASTGTVFFLKQYIESVLPMSLLEAGRIDGAKEHSMFHTIALPIMAPGIATMAIGGFIGSWNSYLVPLVLLSDREKFPLPVMIASLSSSRDIATNQGAIYLAVAISTIPILIAFCFLSKYIISSIAAGSVKE